MAEEPRVARACRWLLAGVFLLAGASKLVDPEGFALQVARLGVLPGPLVAPLAIVLPWVEVVTAAALLLLPAYREAAAVLLVSLLAAFSVVLALDVLRGAAAPCGCFGAGLEGWAARPEVAIARNLLLGAAGVRVFLAHAGADQRGGKYTTCSLPRAEVTPPSATASIV